MREEGINRESGTAGSLNENHLHPNSEKRSNQLTLDAASVLFAESEFQAAVRRFFAATGEVEIGIAIGELHRCRGILILEHGFSLEQLVALVGQS